MTGQHLVIHVRTGKGRELYFKSGSRQAIDREVWGYETARTAGVPVPIVAAVDTSLDVFPEAYLLVQAVSGVQLADLDVADGAFVALIRQTAQHVKALHQTRLHGYGPPDPEALADEPQGLHDSWSHALGERLDADIGPLVAAGILAPRTVSALHDALGTRAGELDRLASSRHLHGDLGSEHVYVDRAANRITGIIDFADTGIGDPAFELMCFDVWHDDGPARRGALYHAYEPDHGIREVITHVGDLYEAMQFLANARFAYERAGDASPHNIDGLHNALSRL